MDDSRDAGIVALAFADAACLTMFLLKVPDPTGAIIAFFFSLV
jgi:hypothetical protein